jgi:hypothetical protein
MNSYFFASSGEMLSCMSLMYLGEMTRYVIVCFLLSNRFKATVRLGCRQSIGVQVWVVACSFPVLACPCVLRVRFLFESDDVEDELVFSGS